MPSFEGLCTTYHSLQELESSIEVDPGLKAQIGYDWSYPRIKSTLVFLVVQQIPKKSEVLIFFCVFLGGHGNLELLRIIFYPKLFTKNASRPPWGSQHVLVMHRQPCQNGETSSVVLPGGAEFLWSTGEKKSLGLEFQINYTWKINDWNLKNQLFEKETHLNQTIIFRF